MASVVPAGREHAIELLSNSSLPIYLGSPHPRVAIVEQEGVFRIRDLQKDEAGRVEVSNQRRRSPSWMPEHYFTLGRPTGKVHVEAESREALAAMMATMEWPDGW